MNIKFPKKLIHDYINGNDIDNYNIEQLEENYLFMIEVIKISKDKRIYNLCSENVKTNYEFVKFLVKTFQDDIPFIIKVSEKYLSQTDKEDITYIELIIILNNLAKVNDWDLMDYVMKAKAFYACTIAQVTVSLEKCNIKDLGYGFSILKEEYQKSDIVINYIAKQLLFDIFYYNEDNITLEELVHIHYKNKNDLVNYGINHFIITYTKYIDEGLSNYLSSNPKLMEPIKKTIEKAIHNWENYLNRLNERRIGIVYQTIAEFNEKNNEVLTFNCYDILDEIVIKLKLDDIFKIEPRNQRYYELEKQFDDKTNLKRKELENKLYKLIKELFEVDHIKEERTDYDQPSKHKKGNLKVLKLFKEK